MEDGMISPLLSKQMEMDVKRLELQMLQLTDLLCAGGGLLVLALIFSSALARECRRVLPYLIATLSVVLLAAFWCVYQVGARQTGMWTTFVVACWWLMLWRWGTFWVPPGHQIVLKSALQPEPVTVRGPVMRFYLPFVYKRVPLLAPNCPPGQYVEVLCTARVGVACGPLEYSSGDGYSLTFGVATMTFSIRDAANWLAPSQTFFLPGNEYLPAQQQEEIDQGAATVRSVVDSTVVGSISPEMFKQKLRILFAQAVQQMTASDVEQNIERLTVAWGTRVDTWLQRNRHIDAVRVRGGASVVYSSSVAYNGQVRPPRRSSGKANGGLAPRPRRQQVAEESHDYEDEGQALSALEEKLIHLIDSKFSQLASRLEELPRTPT